MVKLWLWSAVIAFGVVIIGLTDTWWSYVLLAGGLAFAALLTFRPGRRPVAHG